jgi:hypothetical protein
MRECAQRKDAFEHAADPTFAELFATYAAHIRRALATWAPQHKSAVYTPTCTLPGHITNNLDAFLYEPLAQFVQGKGKFIRPALCMLGAHIAAGERAAGEAVQTEVLPDALVRLACALELFQAAALIHDDIADESLVRRGNPCLYRTHGTGLAINMGDCALVDASKLICTLGTHELPSATTLQLLDEFLTMERTTIEGQALDLGWSRAGAWDLTPNDYLVMAELKTAHYSLASPLVLGALFAQAPQALCSALREFGRAAGVAFQLRDDYLNLFGNKAQGKDMCSDIIEGKRTYLTLYALEHLPDALRHELIDILAAKTNTARELTRACELIEKAGAPEASLAKERELVGQALNTLDKAQLTPKHIQLLADLCHYVTHRSA